ncbi:hypothetical protein VC116059_001689 [Vibrio cholerae O1 str. 116059]|nr:hypothetical protein VCCP10303_1523 [Vibrio cholerae CP1030(3)]EKG78961.1 hypothetical protein VCCP104417_1527 [Vibrio cholerae CP1044(17)]EMP85177.1 hypothetical protein VC116059_001689 [Vibrio cholerae O1 str. 116059]
MFFFAQYWLWFVTNNSLSLRKLRPLKNKKKQKNKEINM